MTTYGVIPNRGDGTVSILDTASASVGSPIGVGGTPRCSAVTRDGRLAYVATGGGDSVVRIDIAANAAVTTIPLAAGVQPNCIVLTADGQKAYVTLQAADAVAPIDLTTDTVGTAITVGTLPHGLALSPDGTRLYVANTLNNSVSVIDTTTDTITATILVGSNPIAVAVTPDGTKAYVANNGGLDLSVIDTATNTVSTTISLTGSAPDALDISPDGSTLYATSTDGTLTSIVVSSDTVGPKITPGVNLIGVAFTPNGQQAWVLDQGTNQAFPIDVAGSTAGSGVGTGTTPSALAPFLGPNVIIPTGGPLLIGDDSDLTALSFPTGYVTFNGGTLQLTNDWTSSRTVSLLIGGAIDTGSSTATLSGPIIGIGALAVIGSGTVIYSGTATHAQTTVFSGTFEVDGTHAPDLSVDHATLSGTGTVGNVTATCTSTFSPGTALSPGTLTSTGHVSFTSASTLNIRLLGPTAGTDYDQFLASGGIDLNDATLSLTLGYVPSAGATFTIATGVTGTFAGLAEGATITLNGKTFHITYHGGSGSDAVLMLDSAPVVSTINDVTVAGSTPPVAQHVTFMASDDFGFPGITATSSNQALVSNTSFTNSHICTSYTLDFMPNAHQAGTTTITVTALDNAGNTTVRTFHFTITDAAPTLQPIPNQEIHVGGVLSLLPLTASDDLTDAAAISLTATSSNHALLTDNNILITGGATRRLSAAPATSAQGQTTITVTATDNGGHSVQQSFVLSVTDGPPTITGLGDHTIAGGSVLGPINFTVGDDLTAVGALVVGATSSNSAMLPNADIVLGGSGATRTLTASPVLGASGNTVITVTAFDGTNTTTSTFTLTVTNTPMYFLAEGATSSFFDTDILIANPNSTAAPITLTFYKDDGSTIVQQRTLPATSRTTITAKSIAGLEAAAFATAVASTSGLPLVVERTMTWDASGYGSHGEKANTGAATTWYFAEGSQGYFHTYFLLLNPHAAANVAHVTYFLESGAPLQRDYPLSATSRTTLDIATEPALANQSFGAVITFDLPGMAERAMYFGDSPVYSGGHDAAGVGSPGTELEFAL